MTCEIVFECAQQTSLQTSPFLFYFFDIATTLFTKIKLKNVIIMKESIVMITTQLTRANEMRQAEEETKLLLIQFPLSRL